MRKILYLFALSTALLACTKEKEQTETHESVTINNNQAELNKRVSIVNEEILDFQDFVITNSKTNNFNFKSADDCNQDCTEEISGNESGWKNVNNKEVLCITGNFSGGLNITKGTVKICGTAQLSGLNMSNKATLIINEGAVFSVSNANISNKCNFINYSSAGVNISGGLNNNGTLDNYGAINISGDLNNNGQGEINNYCQLIIAGNFNQNNDLNNEGYIEVNGKVQLNGGSQTNFESGATMSCVDLTVNKNLAGVGADYAGISVSGKTIINGGGKVTGKLDICDEDGIETINGSLSAEVKQCETSIPATACGKAFGDDGQDTWKLVAEVEAPNAPNGSKLSATAIQIENNTAYVSWHWNGEETDYAGLLEVYDLSNPNEPKIVSNLSSTEIDFNHIFIDNENPLSPNLWAIGSKTLNGNNLNSPAWLGKITLIGNNFDSPNIDEYDLPSFSGNAVFKAGSKIYASSAKTNGALVSLNQNNGEMNVELNENNMRHLDISDNYAVALQQDDANSKLYVTNANNIDFANSAQINVGRIVPNDGKNVAHIDNNTVYIATGTDGLKAYNLNSLSDVTTNTYNPSVGLSNGVSTDDKYVYLANGKSGLHILKKDKLEEVGNYNYDGSANYVAAKGNLILVANGTGGLKVIVRE